MEIKDMEIRAMEIRTMGMKDMEIKVTFQLQAVRRRLPQASTFLPPTPMAADLPQCHRVPWIVAQAKCLPPDSGDLLLNLPRTEVVPVREVEGSAATF